MTPEILTPSYDTLLVVISFLVSAAGSYTALWVASNVISRRSGQKASWFNLFLAGLVLGGVGIWSMHFLGMLAYDVPVAIGYRPLETLVSLVAAVAVSTVALGYLSRKFSIARLMVAGPLAGLGVAAMHYLGLGGMRFSGYFDWNMGLVAASVAIAVVAATAALWLAFHAHRRSHRLGAALVMGAAVCTMHYTGMAAASVVCTTRGGFVGADLWRSNDLSAYVVVVAIGILAMVALDVALQRYQARQPARV
jgi:NO-binding membrane sensor protein with MHYT domain